MDGAHESGQAGTDRYARSKVTVVNFPSNGPYRTILADPPWPYKGPGPVGSGSKGFNDGSIQVSAKDHYSLMSIAELKQLPVREVVGNSAHLYLWVTNAFVREGWMLAMAWGFVPKTMLTWMKVKKNDPSQASMKTGYYFRGATEHIIFAVRGSLPLRVSNRGIPTGFMLPREAEHSRKPDFFYDLIEECSPGPRLELFARRPRDGWDQWGNEWEEES